MPSLDELSHDIWNAYREGSPIAPLRETFEDLTIDQAYQVQFANVDRLVESGRKIVGYKVGLTSEAAQKHLGIEHPDLGHLFDNFQVVNGGEYKASSLISPQIEPEIAFELGADLVGPNVSFESALKAIHTVRASLEVVDTRIQMWQVRAQDSIADNASSALFVLGDVSLSPSDLDLCDIPAKLFQNGEEKLVGKSDAVMGNPVYALVYLANELARLGKGLKKGDLVLSGSITAMLPLVAGDTFRCEMGVLGELNISFN